MLALQEAAESHLVGLFEDANLCINYIYTYMYNYISIYIYCIYI